MLSSKLLQNNCYKNLHIYHSKFCASVTCNLHRSDCQKLNHIKMFFPSHNHFIWEIISVTCQWDAGWLIQARCTLQQGVIRTTMKSRNQTFPLTYILMWNCWRGWEDIATTQMVGLNGLINTLRLRQSGLHFPDDIFKCSFLNENVWILFKNSLKFVPKGPINNIPTLVQIMPWRRSGDKPLSESMMIRSLTHLCVTWPQWDNFVS